MNRKEEVFLASRVLVDFINRYSMVAGRQLVGVREMIEQATEKVMVGIQDLSSTLSGSAAEANEILEQTYFKPDSNTKDLVASIQSSVDELFEAAHRPTASSSTPESQADEIAKTHLRRVGGQFSKHMEALSTMDPEVGGLLMRMMGALSSDDVIRQRLEHVVSGIQALQIGLSYVLIDFRRRFTLEETEVLKADLLHYTFDCYSSESEKQVYLKLFGAPPPESPGRNRF